MKRFIFRLAIVLMLVVAMAPVSFASGLCQYECNIYGYPQTCIFTGNCSYRCIQIEGGCGSTVSAYCLDSCGL